MKYKYMLICLQLYLGIPGLNTLIGHSPSMHLAHLILGISSSTKLNALCPHEQ